MARRIASGAGRLGIAPHSLRVNGARHLPHDQALAGFIDIRKRLSEAGA